jgi:ATP diphosphatase
MTDELGDLLFVLTNLARRLDIDPEEALRGANSKFERRFRRIEDFLHAEGRGPAESSLEEMEALWQQAKREER